MGRETVGSQYLPCQLTIGQLGVGWKTICEGECSCLPRCLPTGVKVVAVEKFHNLNRLFAGTHYSYLRLYAVDTALSSTTSEDDVD